MGTGNLVPVVKNNREGQSILDACGVTPKGGGSWSEWPVESVIGTEFWLSMGGVKKARVISVVLEVPKQVGGGDTGLGLFYSFDPDGYGGKECVCSCASSRVWVKSKFSFGGGISALKNDMINGRCRYPID